MVKRIILASQSPRRKTILEWAEVEFEVEVKDTDESFPADLAKEEVPIFIARNKARAIEAGDKIVIAADTVVVLGDEIIGKPRNREDALRILSALSGKFTA